MTDGISIEIFEFLSLLELYPVILTISLFTKLIIPTLLNEAFSVMIPILLFLSIISSLKL